MTDTELKGCPFCGSDNVQHSEVFEVVTCLNCTAEISACNGIEKWNTRALDSRCGEMLEAAKLVEADYMYSHTISMKSLRKAIAAFEESSAALQKQLRWEVGYGR